MTKRNAFSAVVCGAALVSGLVSVPVLASGPVDISIVEVVDDGMGGYKPWEDIVGAMPGETYSAIPRIKNNGLVVAEVEMCLSESATNAGGETITLPSNTFEIIINEHWVLDDEGAGDSTDPASGNCYKYDASLEPTATTEPIFAEVTLSSALENEYQGATFNLHLDAFATGDVPEEPDTGLATFMKNFVKPDYILYALGSAALIVFAIHLIRSFIRRK